MSQCYESTFEIDLTSYLNAMEMISDEQRKIQINKCVSGMYKKILAENSLRECADTESGLFFLSWPEAVKDPFTALNIGRRPLFVKFEFSVLPRGDPTSRENSLIRDKLPTGYPEHLRPEGFSVFGNFVKSNDETRVFLTIVCLTVNPSLDAS